LLDARFREGGGGGGIAERFPDDSTLDIDGGLPVCRTDGVRADGGGGGMAPDLELGRSLSRIIDGDAIAARVDEANVAVDRRVGGGGGA